MSMLVKHGAGMLANLSAYQRVAFQQPELDAAHDHERAENLWNLIKFIFRNRNSLEWNFKRSLLKLLGALKLLEYCEKILSRWSSFLKLLSSDAHRCDSNESWRRIKLCSLKFNYIQSRDSLFRRPDLWKCNYDNEKVEEVIVGMELSGSVKVLISRRFELPDNSCEFCCGEMKPKRNSLPHVSKTGNKCFTPRHFDSM